MGEMKPISESTSSLEMTLHSSRDVLGGGGVEISQIGNIETGPIVLWDRRIICEVVFLFCREGEVLMSISDHERRRLTDGEFCVLFPGKCLTLETKRIRNHIEFVFLRGEGAVKAVLSLGYWDLYMASDGGRNSMLRPIVERFEKSVERGRDHQALVMTELCLENLWNWIRGISGCAEFYDTVKALNALPPEKMTTESAAAELGISRSKLNMQFLQFMGIRPGEYLARTKMATIIALLLNSQLTVGKIAEKMGYSSTSALATFFRKRTGSNPNVFRKRPITVYRSE